MSGVRERKSVLRLILLRECLVSGGVQLNELCISVFSVFRTQNADNINSPYEIKANFATRQTCEVAFTTSTLLFKFLRIVK